MSRHSQINKGRKAASVAYWNPVDPGSFSEPYQALAQQMLEQSNNGFFGSDGTRLFFFDIFDEDQGLITANELRCEGYTGCLLDDWLTDVQTLHALGKERPR